MTRRINLALQGGGAHGAFTWGVLDRILEQDEIQIDAISGTSAGALNAVAVKAGFVHAGPEGARKALAALWASVGTVGDLRLAPWMQLFWPFATLAGDYAERVFPVSPQGIAAQFISPYSWGPAWKNPLEPIVDAIDFNAVTDPKGPRLYLGATNVRTGKVKIFEGAAVTREAVLASACLPTVFKAVEIDGEAYWDGGFSGNPPLYPLFDLTLPDDIVIVQVNPLRREKLPTSPLDIQDRITEISFNAPLLGEMRAIRFVNRLIAKGVLQKDTMKDVRLHLIADDDLMNDLSGSTKILPNPALLKRLRAAGHRAADQFLDRNLHRLGEETTLDLAAILP